MSILKFCATAENVAARFHEVLDSYGTRVLDHTPKDRQGEQGADESVQAQLNSDYLLTVPADGNPTLVDLSIQLFTVLKKPFDDPSGQSFTRLDLSQVGLANCE